MSSGFANSYPNWLGTATTTANAATTSITVAGSDAQGKAVNTTVATIPTFPVQSAIAAGGITINSLTAGTPSTFSTCMLSTGTYWMYCDIAANSNTTGWAATDSINFWVSDTNTFTSINATAWPDLAGRPYFQAWGGGSTTPGQGNMSMNYSGWLTLTQNSVVYNNVQINSGTSAQNNKFNLYNWSFQKMR